MRESFTIRGLLPQPLADALELVQRPLPTDPLSAVVTLLTGYSGVLKLGWRIAADHTFCVPVNLFLANVGVSGLAKTPIKRKLIDEPAAGIRLLHKRDWQLAVERWEEQCAGIKRPGDRPPKPLPRMPHVGGNYNPASLDIWLELHEQDGLGMLIVRDELSGMLQSIDADTSRGSGHADSQLLEMFDGSPASSLRVDNFRSYERCHVSIYGNIQPQVLQARINGSDPQGRWARFLWCQLPARPLELTPDEPTDAERRAYANAQEVLANYAMQLHGSAPKTITLTPEARRIFQLWWHDYQVQALAPTTPPVVGALMGKTSAHALRLAGMLHVVHNVMREGSDRELEVTPERMRQAMDIVDVLVTETRFFHRGTDDLQAECVKRVHAASWNDGAPKPVKLQQLKSNGVLSTAPLRSAGLFLAAIQQLEEMGFGTVTKGSGRGAAEYVATRSLSA